MTFAGEGFSSDRFRIYRIFWLNALDQSIHEAKRPNVKRLILASFITNCEEGEPFGRDFYRDFPIGVGRDGRPVNCRVYFSVNRASSVVFLKYLEVTD
jgi:hypothetical protein